MQAIREAEEMEKKQLAIRVDQKYVQDLDEGLERFHHALIRAKVRHMQRERRERIGIGLNFMFR